MGKNSRRGRWLFEYIFFGQKKYIFFGQKMKICDTNAVVMFYVYALYVHIYVRIYVHILDAVIICLLFLSSTMKFNVSFLIQSNLLREYFARIAYLSWLPSEVPYLQVRTIRLHCADCTVPQSYHCAGPQFSFLCILTS